MAYRDDVIGEVIEALRANEHLLRHLSLGAQSELKISDAITAHRIRDPELAWRFERAGALAVELHARELQRLYQERAAYPDEVPLDASLDGGRFVLSELLYGGPERGVYRGRDGARSVLVTVGGDQRKPIDTLSAELAMETPGVTLLRHIGTLDLGRVAMVEDEPSAPAGMPTDVPGAIARAHALAELVRVARTRGIGFGWIRPELIYGDQHSLSIAPRCERFLTSTAPAGDGVAPCFDYFYAAPEVLADRFAPIRAESDVFTIGAILARWASNAHPFAGFGAAAQVISIMVNERTPWDDDPLVGALVDKALAPSPADRPSLEALTGLLEDLVDLVR